MFDEMQETATSTTTPTFNRSKMKHDYATGVILALLLATSITYGFRSGFAFGGSLWGVFYGLLTGLLCEGFAWVSYHGLRAATGKFQMMLAGFGMLAGAGAGAVISMAELSTVFAADTWVSNALIAMAVITILYAYTYRTGDALQWAVLKLRIHANTQIFGAVEGIQEEATSTALDDVADDMAHSFRALVRTVAMSILPPTRNEGDTTGYKFRGWASHHWQRITDRIFNTGDSA